MPSARTRPRLQWRDPLIGRSVLIGLIFGTIRFLVACPVRQVITAWRAGEPSLFLYDLDLVLGQREAVAELLEGVLEMGLSFFLVVALVVLRLLVKRSWLAVGLAMILWSLMGDVGSVKGLTYGIIGSAISMAVLLRWGVVAMLVVNLTAQTAWIARTTDWSAWHAQAAVMALVFVAALTIYGLWAAMGGRVAARAAPAPSA